MRRVELLVLASLLPSILEAGAPVIDPAPGLALARYVAALRQATPWPLETVEIEASLPGLEKAGRLRAIRRLLPRGTPEYQVVASDGDRTVKQQVIARYLSGEVRASEIPSSTVAITPANYKFQYVGWLDSGSVKAYIFNITPRRKREGLIRGQLWIDAESGLAVRQSGYLVKSPSVFVKRVDVTRETYLRDGVAERKVTRVSVETRLVGRGELTIYERPCGVGDCAAALVAQR